MQGSRKTERQRGRSPRQRFYSAKIGQKSKDANISERGLEGKGEMGTQMEGLLTENSQKEQATSHPVIHRDAYSQGPAYCSTPPPSTCSAITASRTLASATATVPSACKGQGSVVHATRGGCDLQAKLETSHPYPFSQSPPLESPRPSPITPITLIPLTLHLLELARLTVHSRQQQPGGLADIVAVHGKAAAVASVRHGHSDPLHQRGQHEEGPAQEERGGDVLGPPGNQGCSDP